MLPLALTRDTSEVSTSYRWVFLLFGSLILVLTCSDPRQGRYGRFKHSYEFQEFARSLGPVRTFEGRLTGGFGHASYPVELLPSAKQIIARFNRQLERNRQEFSHRDVHEVALLRLLQGEVDEAISGLQEIALQEPENPLVLSDLSVAYLFRSDMREDPLDLLLALASAEKAVSLDSTLLEAQFNLALALEKFFIKDKAAAAWLGYLFLDPSSHWAVEVHKRIEHLARPTTSEEWRNKRRSLQLASFSGDGETLKSIVSRFRQASRTYAEEDLLGSWADASARGDQASAEQKLAVARSIGLALKTITGDLMLTDAIDAIDESIRLSDASRLQELIEAHLAFRRGLDHLRAEAIQKAHEDFSKAQVLFASARSSMQGWALTYVAVCEYYDLKYRAVFSKLAEAETSFPIDRYPVLHGRFLWMMGLSHFARTNLHDSLEYFQRSLDSFELVGESENIAALNFLLAQNHHYIGEKRKAWAYRYRALSQRNEAIDPKRVVNILYDAADASHDAGQPRVAKLFRDEQVRAALAAGSPSIIAEAYHRRSATMSLLGDLDSAASDLQQAYKYSKGVREHGIRSRLIADLRLADAELKKRVDPEEAIRELSDALEFFQEAGFGLDIPQVLLLRAQIYEERGDLDFAEKDLSAAVSEYRRRMDEVGDKTLAGAVGQGVTEVFHRMIAFQAIRRVDARQSFDFAEEARARAIWDTLRSTDLDQSKESIIRAIERRSRPLTSHEVQRQLDENTILVEYSVLADVIIAWVIDRHEVRSVEIRLDADALESEVRDFRRAILENSVWAGQIAERLFRDILQPLIGAETGRMSGRVKLIIVPDGILQQIPFAALKDPRSRKFIIENFDIGIAPSATLYMLSLRHRMPSKTKVIALGASSFERHRYKWLPSLPWVEKEALLVASGYPLSRALVSLDVTRESFLKALERWDIVHFAGHALINQEFPLESRLLMHGRGRFDSGELTVSDLYSSQGKKSKLVILSSCGSAGGETEAFQGLSGFGRGFLVNGVPSVVGTHWPIADKTAKEFLIQFHRLIKAGQGPVAALSATQREALRSHGDMRELRKWASFQVIGDIRSSTE